MNIRHLFFLLAGIGSLFGCSGGGAFMPHSGPHAMDARVLDSLVRAQAMANRVPMGLVRAMIAAESGGDPSAVSRSGAQGLMQLMPATAVQYGVLNPFDPQANVEGGTRYLHDLLVRYHDNIELAVAAYNAGPSAVDAAHGIPSYRETRAYVSRVTAAYRSSVAAN